MSTNLTAAHHEWSNRPADERFWSLAEMRAACVESAEASTVKAIGLSRLHAIVRDDDLRLTASNEHATATGAALTHYAFGQLCSTVGAPASYLRGLPPHLAADLLNHGIERAGRDTTPRQLLFRAPGGSDMPQAPTAPATLRAMTSTSYDRIWNWEIIDRLAAPLESLGWRVPAGRAPAGYRGPTRPATNRDILPGQINISAGDPIAPSGLYASDHDAFLLLVAADRAFTDEPSGGAFMRGVMIRNSEVGAAALSVTAFLMQTVCGNHIIWGARNVHEIRLRHVGRDTLGRAARAFELEMRRYHDESDRTDRAKIAAARKHVLGTTKEECLAAIAKYVAGHSLPLPRATIAQALDVAADHEDWYGNPRSLFAAVAGLTHVSQGAYTDERAVIDRAAGRLLDMVAE